MSAGNRAEFKEDFKMRSSLFSASTALQDSRGQRRDQRALDNGEGSVPGWCMASSRDDFK